MASQDKKGPKLVVSNVVDLDSKRTRDEPTFVVELEEDPHTQICEMLENAKNDLSERQYVGAFLTLVEDGAISNYKANLSEEEEVLYRQLTAQQVFAEWSEDDED